MTSFRILLLVCALLAIIFVCTPLIMLVSQSLSSRPGLWPSKLTLQWYILEGDIIIPSVITSLSISTPATIVAVLISLPLARALTRYRFKGKELIRWLITLPIIIPGVALGLAYLQFMNVPFMRSISPRIMFVAAHTVIALPYVARSVLAGHEMLDVTLEEASATLGARPFQTYFMVVVPNLIPFILAGSIVGFTRSINDFIITIFLVQPNLIPLSVQIYRSTSYGTPPLTSALATVLLSFSVIFAVLAEILFRRYGRLT